MRMGGSQRLVGLDELHHEEPFNPNKGFSKFSMVHDTLSLSDLRGM